VGDGVKVSLGTYPWVGCAGLYKLRDPLINSLKLMGYQFLNGVADTDNTNIWNKGWQGSDFLRLNGEEAENWSRYVKKLKQCSVNLRDEEEDLVWSKNSNSGRHTATICYKASFVEKEEDQKWWWKIIWKLKTLSKTGIFLCLALSKKILTLDNCKKRAWSGPGRCTLCKNEMYLCPIS
jgi:hypothetical protein